MTTPITSTVIREATRSKVASVLPAGSAVILVGIGRRDDARIAAMVTFQYPDREGDRHTVWAVATLDGALVEQVIWANTEAQADIDFMRVAL